MPNAGLKYRRPKLWIALLLSFLLPGLGHFYSGAFRSGRKLIVLFFIVYLSSLTLPVFGVFSYWSTVIVWGLTWVIAMITVTRSLPKQEVPVVSWRGALRPASLCGIYLAGIILMIAVRAVMPFQRYTVPSGSMAPAFPLGSQIAVDKYAYSFVKPKVGDVAIYSKASNFSRRSILDFKRVVAGPGDTIEIRDMKVFVNHAELPSKVIDSARCQSIIRDSGIDQEDGPFECREEQSASKYIVVWSLKEKDSWNFKEGLVPPNNYFLLGDLRSNSLDSRFIGTVPIKALSGRVLYNLPF